MCIIISIIRLEVLENYNTCDYEDYNNLRVNITNTTCLKSTYIGRKIFFHTCLKDNATVYDLRYFWLNEDRTLRANIFGIQMSSDEFVKICNFCVSFVNKTVQKIN